ncbi:radical SAM protein [candidate division KSB3 bacterium]|uniref:Radical SAM protein n=1 Tax=candidate division KSB3 bacterium TaxID=2044937 RepID=A0A9D5JZN7_9BACT|nr:radical SAM protein [candidate division KSB3 bacterium]MBD3327173.1 radical SAM protein [candidate division KSB3 bacterium]
MDYRGVRDGDQPDNAEHLALEDENSHVSRKLMSGAQSPQQQHVLLIHPWIYDFAAFDLWLKPLGLLYLAGHLRRHGYAVHLLDCLDRSDPDLLAFQGIRVPRVQPYGVGKFFRQRLPTPHVLRDFPYPYRRYGIPEALFVKKLRAIPPPDAIFVTSMMTYWYPGVFRAIELAKAVFPGVPVVLGGVYATLCAPHASRYSQADYIVQAREPAHILQFVDDLTGFHATSEGESSSLFDVYPAYDLYQHLDYACLMTSLGCPYRCTYCASHLLCPGFTQRSPEAVLAEIAHLYHASKIRNFAFYDDALLVNASEHLMPLMERIIAEGLACSFHTPNGLHARYITERVAELMARSGFQTIRISLETTDTRLQQRTGGKVTSQEFERAVEHLTRAGFRGDQIGVYLFVGLPGQELQETEATIRYVHEMGVLAQVCEYSPIPGTPDWDMLVQQGEISPDDDPLLHNNSVFGTLRGRYTFAQMQAFKDLTRALNRAVKARYA